MRRFAVAAALLGSFASVPPAFAQVTPAAGYTPPDDTPSIKVGVTIYTDFTYQQSPEATDADANRRRVVGRRKPRSGSDLCGCDPGHADQRDSKGHDPRASHSVTISRQ